MAVLIVTRVFFVWLFYTLGMVSQSEIVVGMAQLNGTLADQV
jgi:hypothetical protein